MTDSPYPPDYIKVPPAIACASVDDALIVTMARILGLCWGNRYRRSPAYTPDQLAGLLGRPRTTLYRHLNELQDLGWLRVDRRDRKLVLQPLIQLTEDGSGRPLQSGPGGNSIPEPDDACEAELRDALQEAGIIGRPLQELLSMGVDRVMVRAWHLWTQVHDQAWLDNPAGYVVNRLRDGDVPPSEFLELAQLTPDEIALLRRAWSHSEQYTGWPSLNGREGLQRLAPLWLEIHEATRGR